MQEAMLIFLLLIQIIAESFPISSSGHVMLAQKFLQQHGHDIIVPTAMLWLVHGITAFCMMIIMARYWTPLLRHPWRLRMLLLRMACYGVCAEIITTLLYVYFHDLVADLSVVPGFLITALLLFSLKFCHVTDRQHPFFVWIITGIAQGIAVIPGCSRLAATYSIARWLGYSGRHALLLSFTLALPLFISASLYGVYEYVNQACHIAVSGYDIILLIVGSCMAYSALRFTSYLMITDRAYYFSWYLMALVLLLTV